uniref:Uncharacterized protein n=1 Tax=Mesocestoides corti TaxID=53468 RepID=A0A5K3F5K4_MESCO
MHVEKLCGQKVRNHTVRLQAGFGRRASGLISGRLTSRWRLNETSSQTASRSAVYVNTEQPGKQHDPRSGTEVSRDQLIEKATVAQTSKILSEVNCGVLQPLSSAVFSAKRQASGLPTSVSCDSSKVVVTAHPGRRVRWSKRYTVTGAKISLDT